MFRCCTVGYKWVTVMGGVKFEFNDIISLYTKNDFERRKFVSLGYFILNLYYYYLLLIIDTVASN